MATLHECFLTDFSQLINVGSTWTLERRDGSTEPAFVRLHLDFDANIKFLSFYLPEPKNPIGAINFFLNRLDTALNIDETVGIYSQLPADEKAYSRDLVFSGRIFFYVNTLVDDGAFNELKELQKAKGVNLRLRDVRFALERSRLEKPLAFISHDSRDKENIATPIAQKLSALNCPVWFDEYSLKVGDSLRESIEGGLKECKKCILILSPNFLKNQGWTKTEFNTIFTREVIEAKKLVLPVWCGVDKKELFEYSPILVDRVGVNWDKGVDVVVHKLRQAIFSTE